MKIAEKHGVVQCIEITSGASQIELNIVCRPGGYLVLTEQDARDLRDELDNHIAKLASARQPPTVEVAELDVALRECA